MNHKAEVIGRFVRFFTKGKKQFSRFRPVWFKNYRSNKEALMAKDAWETTGRILWN